MFGEPIFEVIVADKHYKIYENGRIEGFEPGAIVKNRIRARMRREMLNYSNRSKASACPISNPKPTREGWSQSTAE